MIPPMEHFDALVVGSGSGMMIAEAAINLGMKVALVEMGKLGGTCLNTGCIPSKMVIYSADIINQIKHAERLGIHARIDRVDFGFIMHRAREAVEKDRKSMEQSIPNIKGLKFYPARGEFVANYTMMVRDEKIMADNVFIVSGSRPQIPDIKGLSDVEYLTNENVWDLEEAPKSIIIMGGGFVAVEMAHFFSSMGTETTILSRSPKLLKKTEPEISEILTTSLRERMHIETNVEFTEVSKVKDGVQVKIKKNHETQSFTAKKLFIATGRTSNSDILKVAKTGVELDAHGFIKVNESYETNMKHIYAFGDAIGEPMFRHLANKEAEVVWHWFKESHLHPINYDKVPYAVFTWPQIASVGLTESEAIERGLDILIGEYNYIDTAKGAAMDEEDGYVKIILEDEKYTILGAHIIGPYAPILIQEIVNVMYAGDGTVYPIADAIYVHPALPEVIQRAIYNLRKPS
jgi:mycothione reductase